MTLNELLALAKRMKNPAEHPTKTINGKIHFWSLTRKEYVESACQPKRKK